MVCFVTAFPGQQGAHLVKGMCVMCFQNKVFLGSGLFKIVLHPRQEQTQALLPSGSSTVTFLTSLSSILSYILNVAGHGLIQCTGLMQTRMGSGDRIRLGFMGEARAEDTDMAAGVGRPFRPVELGWRVSPASSNFMK